MKAAKNPKNLKEMPYPPKKRLLKRKRNNGTTAKTNVPIPSECLKLKVQTYRMRNEEFKMKLEQLQEEISKASLPISTNLSNGFKLIIL